MTKPLQDRIALVTGASRGIGHSVALALAKAGAHVIAVSRTTGGLEELDDEIQKAGGSATLVPLDLKDMDGIARLGGALFDRYKKLDILVGNAGILGPLSPLSHVEPKAWDEIMAVNVTANWQSDPLHGAAAPVKSDAGRAVFLSSGVSWMCARLLGPLRDLQGRAQCDGADLGRGEHDDIASRQSAHPGPIRTKMRAQAMPGEDPMTLETPKRSPTRSSRCACPPSPRPAWSMRIR